MKEKKKFKMVIRIATSLLLVTWLLISGGTLAEGRNDGLENFTKKISYSNRFEDVDVGDWFYDSVSASCEYGLMVGKSEESFDPNGSVTFAEAATMAVRLHSIYTTGTQFIAVTSPWYEGYIDYLVLNGVIQDGDCYMEHANEVITRLQFAQLFVNAMPGEALAEKNLVSDGDIPDVSLYDVGGDAVYTLYRAGVLIGSDGNGTFNPKSDIRRSEVAAIVVRMAVVAERKSVELSASVKLEVGTYKIEGFNDTKDSLALDGSGLYIPSGYIQIIDGKTMRIVFSNDSDVYYMDLIYFYIGDGIMQVETENSNMVESIMHFGYIDGKLCMLGGADASGKPSASVLTPVNENQIPQLTHYLGYAASDDMLDELLLRYGGLKAWATLPGDWFNASNPMDDEYVADDQWHMIIQDSDGAKYKFHAAISDMAENDNGNVDSMDDVKLDLEMNVEVEFTSWVPAELVTINDIQWYKCEATSEDGRGYINAMETYIDGKVIIMFALGYSESADIDLQVFAERSAEVFSSIRIVK